MEKGIANRPITSREKTKHVTVHVPETLPEDVLQELIQRFEAHLEEEARNPVESSAQPSKWTKVAQEAHEESPLQGLSDYVLECSQEIRDHFVFHHDVV